MEVMKCNMLKGAVIIIMMIVHGEICAQVNDANLQKLEPKSIVLNLDSNTYQSVLNGFPETVGMYSGLVTLAPGETVGHHNTDEYEEILVVFGGEGQMVFTGNKTLILKYGIVAYCPPHTEHDVKNTGTSLLKYIYIASKTK